MLFYCSCLSKISDFRTDLPSQIVVIDRNQMSHVVQQV